MEQSSIFSYISPEERVPADHPIRAIRRMVDRALVALSRGFDAMYSTFGRPSIAPEKLLRALLLQIFYSIRSERQLMEQLNYNLLFRWFVGLNMDEEVWDPTVYTRNRERLLEGDVAEEFFQQVLAQARQAELLSAGHFSVDGRLIEAWAARRVFSGRTGPGAGPPEDPGNPTVDFHGKRRGNATHQSTTDPEALLARKSGGHEARLSYNHRLRRSSGSPYSSLSRRFSAGLRPEQFFMSHVNSLRRHWAGDQPRKCPYVSIWDALP